jgi:hypothetical protein
MTSRITHEPVYNVICMKWGDAYTAHYVNVLHNMVRR